MSAIAVERPRARAVAVRRGIGRATLFVLVEGDELVAEPGVGRFVQRARFGEELKSVGAAVTA